MADGRHERMVDLGRARREVRRQRDVGTARLAEAALARRVEDVGGAVVGERPNLGAAGAPGHCAAADHGRARDALPDDRQELGVDDADPRRPPAHDGAAGVGVAVVLDGIEARVGGVERHVGDVVAGIAAGVLEGADCLPELVQQVQRARVRRGDVPAAVVRGLVLLVGADDDLGLAVAVEVADRRGVDDRARS